MRIFFGTRPNGSRLSCVGQGDLLGRIETLLGAHHGSRPPRATMPAAPETSDSRRPQRVRSQ